MSQANQDAKNGEITRKNELQLFLFLTVVLIPALVVAGIAAYGFFVWIYQIFAGPPTV